MRCVALLVQLLCLATRCVAIRITNEEFDVQPNLDFEVTWTDVVGDRVDISLWEWPVYRYVETLSRGNPQYGKEISRMVLIPHDIPPREYCFRVVEWPGGDSYDWSDGFFFNGTGEAVTITATTEISSTWSEDTSSPTTTHTQPSNEAYPPNDDNHDTRPPLTIVRNRQISPLMLALICVGAFVILFGVVCCILGYYRSKKKKKRVAAEAIAERTGGDATAANGPSQGATTGSEMAPEKQEVVTESNGVKEYYAPTARA